MTVNKYIESIRHLSLDEINMQIESICGISCFFSKEQDIDAAFSHYANRKDKEEYGDWQTSLSLAKRVCLLLKSEGYNPQVIIEPTCGKGNFILAALEIFDNIEDIYGIEIYRPYIEELKIQILQKSLERPISRIIRIHLYHHNFFEFDFRVIKNNIQNRELLVLGNPPWVTNSKLGEIKSDNLPSKSNFKRNKGLDAITGKGNFDIAESICIQMVKQFLDEKGGIALLIKNSVIKNVVYEQRERQYSINPINQYKFDAQKEFGVSVAASLFQCDFTSKPSLTCNVYDFYTMLLEYEFGWLNDKFVANMSDYVKNIAVDGISPLKWWSGLKHDCSKVMELERRGNHFINGFAEEVNIESDCVYPLLKSSDIKGDIVKEVRKYVIVTQHSTSDNTDCIQVNSPKTYQYLLSHANLLDNRGSSIYRNRPRFCLFGIGKYSFKKYKVAVSGLYKHTRFSLIEPIDGKPVMLDDTCYLLGFDTVLEASITRDILNYAPTQHFIRSLVFYDAKRIINKDLLMRINIFEAAKQIGYKDLNISKRDFDTYLFMLRSNITPIQMALFD